MNVLRSCGQLPPQSLLKDIKPTLDFPDFLSLISRLGAHPVDSEEKEVREAFTTFDPERTGTVSLQQLKKVLSNVGERLTPDELDDFVKEIGETKDGRIAIDDCVRVLTNRV
ncbi:hypothetical protein HKX48_000783 [Thoreauomyces humboldtii]|nr:hypothetical protein HKX48_000783 [Thoreauomyces humboldtii]